MRRILQAARQSFAHNGFAGTTLRAVAADAGVDPRLVGYYFGNKSALLDACLTPPPGYLEQVQRVVNGPLHTRGHAMVDNMLRYWEDPDTAPILRAIVLTAAHDPTAKQRLTAIFRHHMINAVADGLDDDQRHLRANLAAATIIGICMTRYIYQLEPLSNLSPQDVATLVGPTVQQYLTGQLPQTPYTPPNETTAAPRTT